MFNLFKKKKERLKTIRILPLKVMGGEVVKRNSRYSDSLLFWAAGAHFLEYKPGQFLNCDFLTLGKRTNVDHIVFVTSLL